MYQQNTDQYVAQIIQKHAPSSMTTWLFDQVTPFLIQWAGSQLSRVFVSGSHAKGTAVRGGTDLDIFISLSPDMSNDLGEINESLYQFALNQGWYPRKQNVSIGVNYLGSKIDLVPGRIQPGYSTNHSLYKNKAGTWTKTNVDMQIAEVKNSQRLNEIKAIKIWRNLHKLEFPSFYLELFVIEALRYKRTISLSSNVAEALRHISKNILVSRILDPGNLSNVISDDLTISEKSALSFAASNSLRASWNQIIW